MKAAALHRRLAVLSKQINPSGSFGQKYASLTDEQRAEYCRWRERYRLLRERYAGFNLYEKMLTGMELPILRRDIRDILFDPTPCITTTMTVAEAGEIYRKLCSGS